VLVHFAIERPAPFWSHTRNLALMGLGALLVIQPMVPFMTGAEDIGYRRDRDVFAVKKTQRYLDATSTTEKIDIYLDNGLDLARTLIWKGWVDYSDGSGSDPALDFIVVTLAAVGLALSLWLAFRERKAAYLLPWIMIPIIAIGPLWNWGGYHRRSLGLLVFILMAAAVALGWMFDRVQRHDRKEFTAIAAGVFVLVLAWYSYTNIDKYWSQRDTGAIGFTFAPELAIAARWASDQPDDVPIYFFAQRWSVNYESSKYLLDGHTALTDGSKEFVKEGQTPGLPTVDRSQDAVIILLQGYIAMHDLTVSQQYPDATRYEGPIRGTTPSFVAYVVPKK
jgi:hypothetical protein